MSITDIRHVYPKTVGLYYYRPDYIGGLRGKGSLRTPSPGQKIQHISHQILARYCLTQRTIADAISMLGKCLQRLPSIEPALENVCEP